MIPVIGNGVVIDPAVLLTEIKGLNERGIDTSKLKISTNAHLITPYHRTIDKVSERFLGKSKIGTTGRGIGPAYADKINRIGIRVQDLFDPSILRQKIEAALHDKNQILIKVFNRKGITIDEVLDEYLGYAQILKPYVVDTALLLDQALKAGKNVLLEGSQGTLLDVDHGTIVRLTCYYYRKAYYRSFWMSPPACAVAEPHSKYTGETRAPLILQNGHRWFFFAGLIFNIILTYDAIIAFKNPEGEWGHMSVGTLVLLLNATMLWLYSASCHTCRHTIGGRLRHFSKHPIRYKAWTWVSKLNHSHPTYAWISLFVVALTDLYVRMVASGTITNFYFF